MGKVSARCAINGRYNVIVIKISITLKFFIYDVNF